MKYFLFPTVVSAAAQPSNQGRNNIHHHHSYADNERDLYTWMLLNDGREWHYSNRDGTQRGSVKHSTRGLARAVWELKDGETVQVDTQWGSWGQLGYDTRGDSREWGGNQQNSGQNSGGGDDSYQVAITTLATARSPDGDYNKATQPYGSDASQGRNWRANWDDKNDWSNCQVVGLFGSDSTPSSWGGGNARNGGVGSAVGIVLYTAKDVNLNWNSEPKDLCEASKASNRQLARRAGLGEKPWTHGLSTGAIVCIVLGSIAFLVLIVVLVWCFCCKGDSGASSI